MCVTSITAASEQHKLSKAR